MDMSALEGIGLSLTEIKVFTSVLELGECKAGKIIEKTGLQSSSVYNAINSLISRGFLSYIKKSEVKYYKAADPEVILNYLDIKKQEYLKLLPELKARQKKTEEESVEFFKSYRGIKAMISELLKDSKKGDIYRNFSVEDEKQFSEAREHVYRYVKQIVKDKKIIPKAIFHENNRYPADKESITIKRYLNFPLPPNTLIFKNKVAIISWDEESRGILITSQDIAEKYASFFDAMWKIGKI